MPTLILLDLLKSVHKINVRMGRLWALRLYVIPDDLGSSHVLKT